MDQNDKQKILGFVNHMLNIPNIRSEPPLIREGLIITFITKNLPQIRSTLASQDFFPHMNPDETLKMVFQVLKQIVINDVKPGIAMWLGKDYDSVTMGFQQVMWSFGGSYGDENTYKVVHLFKGLKG